MTNQTINQTTDMSQWLRDRMRSRPDPEPDEPDDRPTPDDDDEKAMNTVLRSARHQQLAPEFFRPNPPRRPHGRLTDPHQPKELFQ